MLTKQEKDALIKKFRTENVLMSKEQIEQELKTTHNIELSASTIGRVIAREGFFFADTAAHRRKRNHKLNLDTSFLRKKPRHTDEGSSAWDGSMTAPSSDLAS